MRYVRPFDPQQVSAGQTSPWLISPDEDLGCAVRVRRGGGGGDTAAKPYERFVLVLEGEAVLEGPNGRQSAAKDSMVFIPAGQPGGVSGDADASWIEIEAKAEAGSTQPQVITTDPSKFEGQGFAYQALADRKMGSQSMRINVLQVQPGSGSPDYHIHMFSQIYVIQEGEMTLDVGRARVRAGRNSVVVLPPGVVHRNFNGSNAVERHISLLAPEPLEGEIFDYAVSIHDEEAELMTVAPL